MAQQIVISFNADANFSDLISEVRRANAEIGTLQAQLTGLGASAFGPMQAINTQFVDAMNNSRLWRSSFVNASNEVRDFGRNLDRGRLRIKDYYREFSAMARGQQGMIKRLAEEQVRLQQSMLTTTIGPQGQPRQIISTPTGLDRQNPEIVRALRSEQTRIMARGVQNLSTEIINLGKNTQWTGRQLTVGLTVPMTMFATVAATAFKDVDAQLVRLAKVYGDLGGATATEIENIKAQTLDLARSLSEELGANLQETLGLAAEIAATGQTGERLLSSVAETSRLATLGEVDRAEAMQATLSLQSAFNLSTQQLTESINFLNAVENQTSTSLQDLITAIPKAGPVIDSLGGSVQDLALFLTAMREGGVNATESANALKSSLASLINPTEKTREVLAGFGIDIESIVTQNAGDLVGTVMALKQALDQLDPLSRARAIEQLFGKFQFARLTALFDNLGASGSQTLQVMQLMGASTVELAALADRELTTLTESASGKFQRQVETMRANLSLAGEDFLTVLTSVLGMVNKVLEGFNNLPDFAKSFITFGAVVAGLSGPVIMLSGVLLNLFGSFTKALASIGRFMTGVGKFEMLDEVMMANKLSTDQFSQGLFDQAQAAQVAQQSIDNLINSIRNLAIAQDAAASGSVIAPTGPIPAGSAAALSAQARASLYARTAPVLGTGGGGFGRVRGVEFSHGVPFAEIRRMFPNVPESYLEALSATGSFTYGAGKGFQQKLGEKMSPIVFESEPTTEMGRAALAAKVQELTPASRANAMRDLQDMTDDQVRQLVQTREEFAQTNAAQIKYSKIIAEQYKQGAAQANDLMRRLQEAFKTGGAEAAAREMEVSARAISQEFFEKVTSESREDAARIMAILESGDVSSAATFAVGQELAAVQGMIDRGIKETTLSRYLRFSRLITQLSSTSTAVIDNAGAVGIQRTVDAAGTKFHGAVVRLINGEIQVIDSAGNILNTQAARRSGVIRKIEQDLRTESQQLDAAVDTEIRQAAAEVEAAQRAILAGDTGVGTLTPPVGDPTTRRGRLAQRFRESRVGQRVGDRGAMLGMSALGLATMYAPMPGQGANAVANVAGGALMGASMGMMVGPVGAAVGAIVGGLIPAVKALSDELRQASAASRALANSFELDAQFLEQAGIQIRTLEEFSLNALANNSEEAAAALDGLTEAARNASLETSTGQIREAVSRSGSFQEVSRTLENQYLSMIAAGASSTAARSALAAILNAAGKSEYATSLNMVLNRIDTSLRQGGEEIDRGAAIRETIRRAAPTAAMLDPQVQALRRQQQALIDAGVQEYQLRSAQNLIAAGRGADIQANLINMGIPSEAVQSVLSYVESFRSLNQSQRDALNSSQGLEESVDVLSNLMANTDTAMFGEALSEASKQGMLTAETMQQILDRANIVGSERDAFNGLIASTGDATTAAMGLKLMFDGVIDTITGLSGQEIRLRYSFEIQRAELAAAEAAAQDVINNVVARQTGGSGGSSRSEDARKSAIQARIDKLKEEERVERNINRLKEMQLSYEKQRADLSVRYLSAISSGDYEGALLAQLEMERSASQYARERQQAEREISRSNEIERLQRMLDSVGKASQDISSSTRNVRSQINSTINSFVNAWTGAAPRSIESFTKSPQVSALIDKFKELGFNEEEIQTQLDFILERLQTRELEIRVKFTTDNAGISIDNPLGISGINPLGQSGQLTRAQAQGIVQKFGIIEGQFFAVGARRYQLFNGQVFEVGQFAGTRGSGRETVRKPLERARGGFVSGPGGPTSDSIPALLSNGEYVIKAAAVDKYGIALLDRINSMTLAQGGMVQKYGKGGYVMPRGYAEGGIVSSGTNITIGQINITEPGASADEIVATIEKKLFAAKKRSTDKRYINL